MSTLIQSIKDNLIFISTIQINEKIDTKNRKKYRNTMYIFLYRKIIGENRWKTFSYIDKSISDSLELMKYLKIYNMDLCLDIIYYLKKAVLGLVNLKETYLIDNNFVSRIEIVIFFIDFKLKSYTIIQEKKISI